jgi:hypothetical protein
MNETSPVRSRRPVMRRAVINGRPGICYSQENGPEGMLDCALDGERTITGEPRHDLWLPEQVVLGERIG